MNFKIAIPTHRRSNNFIVNELLVKSCVDPNLVYLFVSDNKDREAYSSLYGIYNIVYEKDLPSLRDKHNFIVNYFHEGEMVLIMEDDIILVRKSGGKTTPFYDIKTLASIGFNECVKKDSIIWGITATNNGFFMTNNITYNLKFVCAFFFGLIIDKRLVVSISNKHDYERTALCWKLKKCIVRINSFGIETDPYKTIGGMQDSQTKEVRSINEKKAVLYLLNEYPEYFAINTKRKSGFAELTIRGKK